MDELFDELKKVFEKYEIQINKKQEEIAIPEPKGQWVACSHYYYEYLKETGQL